MYQLLWIVALIGSIFFVSKWRKKEPIQPSLTTQDKVIVWILNICNPIITWLILYYWIRKKSKSIAKRTNKISFIVFFIYLVGIVVIYLQPFDGVLKNTTQTTTTSQATTSWNELSAGGKFERNYSQYPNLTKMYRWAIDLFQEMTDFQQLLLESPNINDSSMDTVNILKKHSDLYDLTIAMFETGLDTTIVDDELGQKHREILDVLNSEKASMLNLTELLLQKKKEGNANLKNEKEFLDYFNTYRELRKIISSFSDAADQYVKIPK